MRLQHIFCILNLLALLLISGETCRAQAELRIIAGTSLIADIVHDLTGGHSTILTLVQGSSCPGHDNAKTQDFVFAAQADMVLVHAFQQDLPQLSGMLATVGTARESLHVVKVEGSWLVPENQKKASRAIAAFLQSADPKHAADINARMQTRLTRVDSLAQHCSAQLARVRGKAILAAQMQAEFLRWAGFEVRRTYGRAEDLSAKELAGLVSEMRNRGIHAVIDNYQSGPQAGLPVALELGIPHLTLSNFPGSTASVPDYFSLLQANVALLNTLP
ncbi:MAG: metal ABC transporter substrate-binding protein [Desulfovibrionaceae bacterium]